MHDRQIAVVGASRAGWATVTALRRHGAQARITLVGDENELPYDRPPLSKDVLLADVEPEAIRLATPESMAALEVELRLGTRALGLDLARRVLTLSDGVLGFDDLVVATGASPRRPKNLMGLGGVHVLRTVDDALAIRRRLAAGPRVVVLGGGLIGAEVASAARHLGLDVTIVDLARVLMQRTLGTLVGGRMTELAWDAGVHLRLGTSVTRVLGRQDVEAVQLADETILPADLLVIGLGALPNVSWLAGSGLTLADGVVCDQYLAAAPDVYVVGDVARWYHPLYNRTIRCEHWTSAGEHADSVAATLAGSPTVADNVPWAWSDQFGVKLTVAGLLHEEDEVRFIRDEPGRFVAIAGSSGFQHAAFGLNATGAVARERMNLAGAPPWHPRTTGVQGNPHQRPVGMRPAVPGIREEGAIRDGRCAAAADPADRGSTRR